jgi:integrase
MAQFRALVPVTGRNALVFRARGIGGIRTVVYAAREVRKATGIADLTAHDQRRSCAFGHQRLGATPHVVSVVLGHAREQGATLVDAAYMHDRFARPLSQRYWARAFSAKA